MHPSHSSDEAVWSPVPAGPMCTTRHLDVHIGSWFPTRSVGVGVCAWLLVSLHLFTNWPPLLLLQSSKELEEQLADANKREELLLDEKSAVQSANAEQSDTIVGKDAIIETQEQSLKDREAELQKLQVQRSESLGLSCHTTPPLGSVPPWDTPPVG